jgi:hypothetical protein
MPESQFTASTPPAFAVFNSENVEIGRLSIVDGKLVFTGNADEAAKVFFNAVSRIHEEAVRKLPATRVLAAHFSMMLTGYELDCEANDKQPDPNAVVSSFMGNGASSSISYDDVVKFLREVGYWKAEDAAQLPQC